VDGVDVDYDFIANGGLTDGVDVDTSESHRVELLKMMVHGKGRFDGQRIELSCNLFETGRFGPAQ
jgi:hypothetical protein